MTILCRVGEIETAVLGFGPGKNGPMAIVAWQDKDGSYVLKAIGLNECQILNLPNKMKKKLRVLSDKRHKRALENTKKLALAQISQETQAPAQTQDTPPQ